MKCVYVSKGEGVFIKRRRWGEVTRWREERRTRKEKSVEG